MVVTLEDAAFCILPAARLAEGYTMACRPRGLVLVPTREASPPRSRRFRPPARAMGPSVAAIFGGTPQNPQVAALRNRADIVVACPGPPVGRSHRAGPPPPAMSRSACSTKRITWPTWETSLVVRQRSRRPARRSATAVLRDPRRCRRSGAAFRTRLGCGTPSMMPSRFYPDHPSSVDRYAYSIGWRWS